MTYLRHEFSLPTITITMHLAKSGLPFGSLQLANAETDARNLRSSPSLVPAWKGQATLRDSSSLVRDAQPHEKL